MALRVLKAGERCQNIRCHEKQAQENPAPFPVEQDEKAFLVGDFLKFNVGGAVAVLMAEAGRCGFLSSMRRIASTKLFR